MKCLLVVDIEATCWENEAVKQTVDTSEIIEFGVVACRANGEILRKVSQLVRPVERPTLTDFCVNLTGIRQVDVASAPVYADAVNIVDEALAGLEPVAWGSFGEYDRRHIEAMARRTGASPQFMDAPHFNIRKVYQHARGRNRRANAHEALKYFGLQWEGAQHRAYPDAFNYARLLPHMTESLRAMLGNRVMDGVNDAS